MFYEPTEKETNLLPLVVQLVDDHDQEEKIRVSGLGAHGQVSLCESGEGIFTDTNGRTYEIKEGDIFFFAPENPHSYKPVKKPWMVKYIVFTGISLSDIFRNLTLPGSGACLTENGDLSSAKLLFNDIFEVYRSGRKSRHITASAYLYSLLVALSKHRSSENRERDDIIRRLMPALQYINANFDDKLLSSELIAENAGMSHAHMCRLFKSAFDISPHDYIIYKRITNSKHLLQARKDLNVQTISDMCGFNSPGYFIKVFKAKTGLTPTQYRAKNAYMF
ncbi:MAG: AraC family transcriptional regulator [Clostridia bacterium]|nr:AraC family transcriptional regulator [Clostridia bacterium]